MVSPQTELPVFDDNDINYIHLFKKSIPELNKYLNSNI